MGSPEQFTISSDKLKMVMRRQGELHRLAEMQYELLKGRIGKSERLALITDQFLDTCDDLLKLYNDILQDNGV